MKLTEPQMTMLKLTNRSKDLGDGWRQVSDVLWNHVSGICTQVPDLFTLDYENKRVILTEEAKILLKWL